MCKHDPSIPAADGPGDADNSGPGHVGEIAVRFLNAAALKLGHVPFARGEPAIVLNDNGRHAEVVQMFDWAIALVGSPAYRHVLTAGGVDAAACR